MQVVAILDRRADDAGNFVGPDLAQDLRERWGAVNVQNNSKSIQISQLLGMISKCLDGFGPAWNFFVSCGRLSGLP